MTAEKVKLTCLKSAKGISKISQKSPNKAKIASTSTKPQYAAATGGKAKPTTVTGMPIRRIKGEATKNTGEISRAAQHTHGATTEKISAMYASTKYEIVVLC